jgi:NAD(P)-dependent dehydrogenase (short-subunit alcohol dehydrogenase family)
MLEEKVVVVTGAGGGIGREVARMFIASGARVVASDLQGRRAQSAVRGLPDSESRFIAIDADISDEGDVAALIDGAVQAWGSLDVLVNVAAVTGAGLSDDSNVVDMTLESWDRVIGVNLRGTMLMCRKAIPVMLDTGGGAIINVSSRAAATGNTRFCAYSASKAGVNSLTMSIAKAFGKRGIRCNAIMPGLVLGTDSMSHASLTPDYLAAAERRVLVNRLGAPSDVAHMVAFLASDELSGYVNGQIFNCDGGQAV